MGFSQAAWSLIFEIYLDKMRQETLEEGDLSWAGTWEDPVQKESQLLDPTSQNKT